MLRRVPLSAVRLGMFVHKMEGSWLDHPFWRRHFLLDDARDLQRLLDSEIPGVIIDDARGAVLDTPPSGPATQPASPLPPRKVIARDVAPDTRPSPQRLSDNLPCSTAEESARANRTIAKSLKAVKAMFGEARMGRAIDTKNVAPLVDEITASIARNPAALIGMARLKNKDEYTYMHSVAVCALMINLARTLELDEDLTRSLGLAGLLHDVGKMKMPDPVLSKPGKLTEEEYALIRQHPERGYDMILAGGDAPAIAADVTLHHHEKYDGTGYPHGLKGEAISLAARMGAICDVYDAITSNRPYKEGWSPSDSIARMMEWDGHFDPRLLEAFIRSIGIYPVGTLVRLRSNRLGIVVAENKRAPTQPKVKAFYAIHDRALIDPELITISTSLRGDAILKREAPEHWPLGDWPTLSRALIGG